MHTGNLLAAVALLAAPLASWAQAPVSDPTRLEARVAQLERSAAAGGSIVQMHQTLQRIEREVRELRGEIELQSHELQQIKQRQREQYLDVDKRIAALENAAAAAPPNPAAANGGNATASSGETAQSGTAPGTSTEQPALPPQPPPSTVASSDPAAEQQAYREAFDLLKTGKFSEAAGALDRFLAKYPNGRFADNAQYWLGESHYVSREFGPALKAFEQLLVDYPDSPKRSHAMLKIGFIHDEQGRKDQAREILTELTKKYPKSTAASLASKRLKRL